MEPIYTPEQVAQLLELQPSTIRRWLRDGQLTGIKIGNRWRVRQRDIDALLRQAAEKVRGD